MPFVLEAEWVKGLMEQALTGNPEPILDAIHPDVRWRIGTEVKDDVAKTGVFNKAEWVEQVFGPLYAKLQDGIKLLGIEVNVIDNKAFLEYHTQATQLNGKPYNNFFFWVIIFKEDGKAHEIREYLHTALVKEVFSNN